MTSDGTAQEYTNSWMQSLDLPSQLFRTGRDDYEPYEQEDEFVLGVELPRVTPVFCQPVRARRLMSDTRRLSFMDEVARTRSVYEENSDAFVEKYRSESIAERFGGPFFDALQGSRVLDVGCGPGSDSETFADRGLDVTGLDVTPSFLESARENVPDAAFTLGDMRHLPFRSNSFDGVWACASLLHVPLEDVPATLSEFARVLDDDGVLYCSLKRGEESGFDGDGRFFERHTADAVVSMLVDAGFEPTQVETADADEVASQDGWVQTVARLDS